MKQTPFDTDIVATEKVERDVRSRLNQLLQERAEYLCPFKVGQQLVNKRGKKAVITRIGSEGYGDGYRLTGRSLKANGKPGAKERRLYEWDGWKEKVV